MEPDGYVSSSERLDEEDEQGWEDVEEDTEAVTIISLFDDRKFQDAKEMLLYCKQEFNFDAWRTRDDLGLLIRCLG
jgi:type I protein arginine methyltransferase